MNTQFLVLGDWGYNNQSKKGNAEEMSKLFAARIPNDYFYVVAVGDNFYPSGVTKDSDSRWETHFTTFFDQVQCPWYPALGNHDYDGDPDVQVEFKRDWRWQMESRYYTKLIGNVQIIVLDTVQLCPKHSRGIVCRNYYTDKLVVDLDRRDAQLLWLTEVLETSAAEWIIVFGW
jgi:tartrate-resistant acid phosphatase type 5